MIIASNPDVRPGVAFAARGVSGQRPTQALSVVYNSGTVWFQIPKRVRVMCFLNGRREKLRPNRPIASAMGLCVLTAALMTVARTSNADLFRYKDGRVIYGEVVGDPQVVEVDGTPTPVWVVEIDSGVFIKVYKSELVNQGHQPLSGMRKAYEQGRLQHTLKTVEDFQVLAAYCQKSGMLDLAAAIREAAIDRFPEDRSVWAAAGYLKDDDGRWRKEEQIMGVHRGKVQHKGRWRFPESVAIEMAEDAEKERVAAASKDLWRWHRIVSGARANQNSPRYRDALNGLQQIQDPTTTATIIEILNNKRTELPRGLRMLYLNLLARFKNPAGAQTLAHYSVNDDDGQIRNACLEALAGFGADIAADIYLVYLTSSDNVKINRAAEGLAYLRSEGAVLPLIAALVTNHVVSSGSDRTNVNTQGGMTFGTKKAETADLQNASVLNALSTLTGQSFGYDRDSWMRWYASTHAAPAGDLRRDL